MEYFKKVSTLLFVAILVVQPIFTSAEALSDSLDASLDTTVVTETEAPVVIETSEENVTVSVSESHTSLDPVLDQGVIDDVVETEETDVLSVATNDTTHDDTTVTTTPNVVDLAVSEPRTRAIDPAAFEALGSQDRYIAMIPGELIVKYRDDAINLNTRQGRKSASLFAQARGLAKKEDLRNDNISVVTVTDEKSVAEKIDELEANSLVDFVQPNYQYHAASISVNDIFADDLWGLDNNGQEVNGYSGTLDADVDAPEAWAINEGTNAPVIVAVIDSGVAYTHPDLIQNMWDGTDCKDEDGLFLGGCVHGYDYEYDDINPFPSDYTHGTHVAGTIAAAKNNAAGTIGVAPHAKIMALKTSLTTIELLKSISFAKENGARIINASWGGFSPNGAFFQEDQLLKDAIATFPGLFIAAAGNSGLSNDANEFDAHFYPSDFDLPNIISVAATDQDDALAYFSNYGRVSVDVGAPGENILSTVPGIDEVTYVEDMDGLVVPNIPDGWTTNHLSTWGSFNYGGSLGNVLYGDTMYPYRDNQESVVTSVSFPLSGGDGGGEAYMNFFAGCDTEYSEADFFDYMQLEFSADGINFIPEMRWDEEWLDAANGEFPLSNVGGSYFYFTNVSIPEEFRTGDFSFQFRWISNATDNDHDGCFVDLISISQSYLSNNEEYEYSNGTSMAAPYVAGLAALIMGYNPGLTDVQVKDIILTSGDDLPSLFGMTVTGKRINAHKALQMVATQKSITDFSVTLETEVIIDEASHVISITVPVDTDMTTLTPTISFTGKSLSPTPGIPTDFTFPVVYTVTALDDSTQTYTVTVTKERSKKNRVSHGSGGGGGGGKKTRVNAVVSESPIVSGDVTSTRADHFVRVLSLGMRGSDVAELQTILIQAGHLRILAPTGYFGPMTQSAVREYQRAHELPQTGVVDQAILAILNASILHKVTQNPNAELIAALMSQVKILTSELEALKSRR